MKLINNNRVTVIILKKLKKIVTNRFKCNGNQD